MKKPIFLYNYCIPVILLLCLGVIHFNTLVNGHFHKIENGVIIFHAHPLPGAGQKSSGTTHQHSRMELLYYCFIMQLQENGIVTVVWGLMLYYCMTRWFIFIRIDSAKQFVFIQPLRAPPAAF